MQAEAFLISGAEARFVEPQRVDEEVVRIQRLYARMMRAPVLIRHELSFTAKFTIQQFLQRDQLTLHMLVSRRRRECFAAIAKAYVGAADWALHSDPYERLRVRGYQPLTYVVEWPMRPQRPS